MNHFVFQYMDKQNYENVLPRLFDILYTNMNEIAPTNNTYETDLASWTSCIVPTLLAQCRETVLMYCGCELVGYFRYYLDYLTQTLRMEEMQIIPAFQGSGVFSGLYTWLVPQLPENILIVTAYAHKKNYKSQAVLKHLGLVCKGENKNGTSFFFQGDYSKIYNKYI